MNKAECKCGHSFECHDRRLGFRCDICLWNGRYCEFYDPKEENEK